MTLHVIREKLLFFTALLFGTVGAVGVVVILFDLHFSRPFVIATILGFVIGVASAVGWTRLRGLGRFHVRILNDRTTLSFRRGDPANELEKGAAVGLIHAVTRYQCLRDSLDSLQLQKFVVEPSRIDPQLLLKDWNYAGRVITQESGACAVQPEPQLSDSRSLLMTYRLPRSLSRGEVFTLTEDMSFVSDLSKPGDYYVFQIRDPTLRRGVDFLFNGLKPEKAGFRLDNGHREYTTGRLEVEETGPDTCRVSYQWHKPALGEELRIYFTWPEEMVLAAEAERAAAGLSPATAEILSAGVEAGAAPPSVPEFPVAALDSGAGEAEEGESAQDHPLIKAARERINKTYGEEG